MSGPAPEGTVVPAADEERYPFAQDLDGTWHRRPHGDTWTTSPGDQPNCRTACGQAIHSARVSEYQPEPDPSTGATLCQCVTAPPAATPGQAMRDELINRWTARGHCVDGRSWDLLPQVDRDDLDAAAQAAIATAVAAERERIRQMAIACRAAAISPTGRMTPFAELLERSPEENAAALLKVVEDARTGLGGGDHA